MSLLLLESCYLAHREPNDDHSPVQPGGALTDAGGRRGSPDAGAAADSSCARRTLRAGERFEPVDMVWVVDSSRSMADEQARIQSAINEFADEVEARSYDLHLVMITAKDIVPAPLGADGMRYLFVQRGVGSHAPLQALLDELPQYRAFLRPEAALHFVIVSDDDSNVSADAFESMMQSALGRSFVVHAVASPDIDGEPCRTEAAAMSADCADSTSTVIQRQFRACGAAAIGRQYYALAEATGGDEISICVSDFGQVFGPLLDAVTPTTIPCAIEFDGLHVELAVATLGDERGVGGLLEQVDSADACGSKYALYFVDAPMSSTLMLCPAACAATTNAGARLEIRAYCN